MHRKNNKAAALADYGIIMGLVSVVAISSVYKLSESVYSYFWGAEDSLTTARYQAAGEDRPADPKCYDSALMGTIADEKLYGCGGMLVVDSADLRNAYTRLNDKEIMGPDGLYYSFSDSERNVFTGQVTDFWNVLADVNLDVDIGYWDVSRGRRFRGMFKNNGNFNSDISSWDTSSADDMYDMFNGASNFNQNISTWDVSNVENFYSMFRSASDFNQNLSNWDVSSGTNFQYMFRFASSFNSPLTGWDLGSAGSLGYMFANTPFNQDISGWDVSNVTSMPGMFTNNLDFYHDLSDWDVSSVVSYNFFADGTILPPEYIPNFN